MYKNIYYRIFFNAMLNVPNIVNIRVDVCVWTMILIDEIYLRNQRVYLICKNCVDINKISKKTHAFCNKSIIS